MTPTDTLSFFATIVAIAVAPGPVVLMLVVRAAGRDARGAAAFGLGYAIGGVTIVSVVCIGLGAWFTAVPDLFAYSKFVLLGYILWVARGIWRGGLALEDDAPAASRPVASSVAAGVGTCFLSPYMMVLFPLTVPELLDVTTIEMPDFAVIVATTFLALATGSALVIGFAAQLTRLARSPRAAARLNRALAATLVACGGALTLA